MFDADPRADHFVVAVTNVGIAVRRAVPPPRVPPPPTPPPAPPAQEAWVGFLFGNRFEIQERKEGPALRFDKGVIQLTVTDVRKMHSGERVRATLVAYARPERVEEHIRSRRGEVPTTIELCEAGESVTVEVRFGNGIAPPERAKCTRRATKFPEAT